ncbi:MAG: DUF3431 domain-containing protein [Verrucomicrobiota bacterium]
MLDLVVSHYNEDLRWLKKVPEEFRIVLYAKGNELPELSFLERELTVLQLPNAGREAHTWMAYLESVAEDPPEGAVLLQGHPFDHCHDAHQRLKALASGDADLPESGFEWWGFIIETDDSMGRRVFVPWSKNEDSRKLDIGKRFEALFRRPGPARYRFYPGGQFAVSAAAIQRNSRNFYHQVREMLEADEDAAYCLERFWDFVFGVTAVSDVMMGGKETVYLKKIKRLDADG